MNEGTPRLVSRAAFDTVFAEGRAAVAAGAHRRQTPPAPGGARWGLSAVLRPDPAAASDLHLASLQAAAAAGGAHWLTGAAASSHLTVRSLEPWREAISEDDPLLQRYAAALSVAARGIGSITFTIAGLTLTPGSVMACAVPSDGRADWLAEAFGRALGPDGWHENEFSRDFWYLNLVHFADAIPYPERLIAWVADHRDQEITTVRVEQTDLVAWQFDGTAMVPRLVGAAKFD